MKREYNPHRTIVKQYYEDGTEVDSALSSQWSYFLSGNWTELMPQTPGRYMAVNWDGSTFCQIFIQEYNGKFGVIKREKSGQVVVTRWDGWYWNRPIPTMMPRAFPIREGCDLESVKAFYAKKENRDAAMARYHRICNEKKSPDGVRQRHLRLVRDDEESPSTQE